MNIFIHERRLVSSDVFCFIGAILPKVCKIKFSNVSYDIFLSMIKRLSLNFSLSKHL